MNEIRDLIIGIDIGKEYTQICYYDRKAEEARSLSMKVGASQYEAPGCICYRTDHGDYCVGLEAEVIKELLNLQHSGHPHGEHIQIGRAHV